MSEPEGAASAPEAAETHLVEKPHKAPSAFRTISEVADDLHIPQHVLRFWETKFSQVKPLKRGGGRRYYRPDDIALLRRISDLLYTQGYTIKGVQRLLREGGGRFGDVIPPASATEGEGAPEPAQEQEHPVPGSFVATGRGPVRTKVETQAAMLRAALEEALHKLEEIRALLT